MTKPTTIILADDHAIIRQGLVPLFEEEQGMDLVAQAGDGREALAFIESLRPDVAILDISMPEMTGIEVTRRVVDAGIDTQTILLTMHEDPAAVLDALESGASGYVLKDNSFAELVQAVRTVVGGGTFISPSVREQLRELQRQGKHNIILSEREREVIKLIAQGLTSKEIGRIMDISPRTVDTYRKRLMDKLGLHTIADIVRYAIRTGMVS